jgi:hypothetical protein
MGLVIIIALGVFLALLMLQHAGVIILGMLVIAILYAVIRIVLGVLLGLSDVRIDHQRRKRPLYVNMDDLPKYKVEEEE